MNDIKDTDMKEYIKMTLATLTGLLLFGFVSIFLTIATIGGIAALGESTPVVPEEAVLTIDFSAMTLAEQTTEADPLAALQNSQVVSPIGIYSAIQAINTAAQDPAVKYIYMKPDAATGGTAQIEEFRTALVNFRNSGKAVVSYMENPTNAGYYLASASDKIYMISYDGGMNTFTGLSSQMIFIKDALDRLGVNVQLIRHDIGVILRKRFIRLHEHAPDRLAVLDICVISGRAAHDHDTQGLSHLLLEIFVDQHLICVQSWIMSMKE